MWWVCFKIPQKSNIGLQFPSNISQVLVNDGLGKPDKFYNSCKQVVVSLEGKTPTETVIRVLHGIKYVSWDLSLLSHPKALAVYCGQSALQLLKSPFPTEYEVNLEVGIVRRSG